MSNVSFCYVYSFIIYIRDNVNNFIMCAKLLKDLHACLRSQFYS